MASSKRQRVHPAVEHAAATQGDLDLKLATELAESLPVVVLKDALMALFNNPETRAQAFEEVNQCKKAHGCDLARQMEDLVEQHVEEPSEEFSRKMGSLANADYELDRLLDKAQTWINLQGYEEAFQLIWACVLKSADFEERGSDGGSWDDWDERADNLLLQSAEHANDHWSSLDLKTQVAAMQDLQNTADAYGSTMFTKSLPMLQYIAANLCRAS